MWAHIMCMTPTLSEKQRDHNSNTYNTRNEVGTRSYHIHDSSTWGYQSMNCGRDTIGSLPFWAHLYIFDASILEHLLLVPVYGQAHAPMLLLYPLRMNGSQHPLRRQWHLPNTHADRVRNSIRQGSTHPLQRNFSHSLHSKGA